MDFKEFIRPELLVLIPVLYLLGAWIKASACKNWIIPFVLMGVGVFLTLAYLLSVEFVAAGNMVAGYIFASITQGILVAGAAVLANNIQYQATVGKLEDSVKPDKEV